MNKKTFGHFVSLGPYVSLLLIVLLGSFLRFGNLSPNKLYPDSYQNLLLSLSLSEYRSVVGYLGQDGMVWPPFLMWARIGYPLLINSMGMFTTLESAAHIVALGLGVLGIIVAFFLGKRIWQSSLAGVFAALLLSVTFSHSVWSGFIMTETTGVFFLLLFLWLFLPTLLHPQRHAELVSASRVTGKKEIPKQVRDDKNNGSHLMDIRDLLSGGIFALATLTRFEYVILLLPILFLIISTAKTPGTKLINIVLASLSTLALFLVLFFPIRETIELFMVQLRDLVVIGGAMSFVLVGFVFFRFISKEWYELMIRVTSFYLVPILALSVAYFILAPLLSIPFQYPALSQFLETDFLLIVFFLFGVTMLLKQSTYQPLALFHLLSLLMLCIIYYRINPTMFRYMTHLIPFLLIPASYAGWRLVKYFQGIWMGYRGHKLIVSFVSLLFAGMLGIQLSQTYHGFREWGDKTWYVPSYDEVSARKLNEFLSKRYPPDANRLLLVSLPEPYYFFTRYSIHSIADTKPFVYIPNSLNNRELLIIQDMGMLDYFPNFNQFLNTTLQDKKIDEYRVGVPYHSDSRSLPETQSVRIYKTTVGELKKMISTKKASVL